MKIKNHRNEFGFTLIEVLMVIVIIGALASIATPQYASYQEDARSVSCQSNRRNIEMDERSHFLANDSTSLNIGSRYSCPSGGVYVWLISDPDNPEYPQIGCSVHYAGLISSTSPGGPGDSEISDDTENTEGTANVEDEKTPIQIIDDLIEYANNMDISKKSVKNNLIKKLDKVKDEIEKDDVEDAIKKIDSFIKAVQKEAGKNIEADDAVLLLSKAQEIAGMI